MSYYGGGGRGSSGPADPKRPMNGTLAAILMLEGIMVGLSTPVMIVVGHVNTAVGLIVGIGVALVAIAASGMQTRPGGRVVGSLVQVATVALTLLEPLMGLLGAVFAGIWVVTLLMEDRVRRIRREKGLDEPTPTARGGSSDGSAS